MQLKHAVRILAAWVLLLFLCNVMSAADVPAEADFCEFSTAKHAKDFGWEAEAVNGAPILGVTSDCKVGRSAMMARGKDFMGDWGTLRLKRDINLAGAEKSDKIVFYVKQNVSRGIYLNIDGGHTYRSFPVVSDEWVRMELDMDPAEWTWRDGQPKRWGTHSTFSFYAREFSSAKGYLMIDGLSFQIGGKQLPSNIPPGHQAPPDETAMAKPVVGKSSPAKPASPPPKPVSVGWVQAAARKSFPQENKQAWLLGNASAFWAISKQNGRVFGGWHGPKRARCLDAVEGAYFLEDKKDLYHASENADVIVDSHFSPATQDLRIECTNPALKDISIVKTYSIRGNTLARQLRFSSGSAIPFFFSYRSEAKLEPRFRQEGTYVGAGGFGAFEAAADITTEMQPIFYANSSRGLILSNPVRGYGFAHYRLKQDEKFVLPWWAYSRAESAKDNFYYTPTGWKIPFGISGLKPGGTVSYEENLTIFPGNYHDFHTQDYGARDEVRKEMESLGPIPAWLEDVTLYCEDGGVDGREYTDFNNIKRLAELTDEGHILVLVNLFGQNFADYYVDQGLIGFSGGYINGPELKEWIQKIQAISPRIKVGLYCYMDMAASGARLFKQHPEWFRATNKEGVIVDHFSGLPGSTSMFNNPECRQALLDQYDLMFKYLGLDFVYLDDAMTNNLVNWETGEVLRDEDCYEFFRGMREVAARNGPDKAVFFNGTGNPYGDFEFVEAYSRLAADSWRPFAGVGLGVETFLINRPGVRVIPLYWTEALSREYINRVLALGWIPALDYTPDVEGRPFVSAAYEIGNADPVNADYQPDWRKQKDIKIESYATRRLGDSAAAMLSFISYNDAPSRQRISVKVDSLGLERGKPLFVWLYRIKDATAYKGFTSEKAVKTIYAKTGWTLDMITEPECRYAGEYKEELALDVELTPRMLTMLVVSNEPGAVYSMDGLPLNFLFSKTRGVELQSRLDEARKEVLIQVISDRERCEIIGFLPPDWRLKDVALDGKAVLPNGIALGDALYPLISVGRGRHVIQIACDARKTADLKLNGLKAVLTDQAIEISLPGAAGASKALVTVRQDDQLLFNRMVEKEQGLFRVPLAPQRGGTCEISVKAVQLPKGMVKVDCAPVELSLPNNPPSLGLTPSSPGTIPEQREISEINKNIRGLDILRIASHITATTVPPFQTKLKGLTVEVSPETLTIDVGTTRKIEGFLGAAFGGFEVKNLRTARIRLKNTYFGAPHISGPNIHTHYYYPMPRLFAGFMVDYHTPAGYTKRVALSVGVVHPQCNTTFPGHGKGGKPDQLVDLGPIITEGTEKEFDLDLSPYAPERWDGQVWFNVGSDWALPGRRLNAQILSAN